MRARNLPQSPPECDSATLADDNAPVCIIIHGCDACVGPGCEQILRDLLTYQKTEFAPDNAGRLQYRHIDVRAYELADDAGLWISTGCVPRVVAALARQNRSAEVRDLRSWSQPAHAIDEQQRSVVETAMPGLGEVICREMLGVIKAADRLARVEVLARICRLLPRARSLIVFSRVNEAREFAIRLETALGRQINCVRGGTWQSACRIVCATLRSFDTSEAGDWDIVVFYDGIESLGKRAHESRAAYSHHRVYAVHPRFGGDEHFVRASGELSASCLRVRLFQSDSRDASWLSAQGARRSPSQGQRPWEPFETGILAPTGPSFVRLRNGRPVGAGGSSVLSFQGRWPWLGERLAPWAENSEQYESLRFSYSPQNSR